MRILTINKWKNYKLNESLNSDELQTLIRLAKGIKLLCNGEYGDTFYNEKEHKVFVMLGDSGPFDREQLADWIKYECHEYGQDSKELEVVVEDECYPCYSEDEEAKDWKVYNNDQFIPWYRPEIQGLVL